jgi:sulfatase maturation enzyme AslB (radical SAM superfamily)
LVRRRAAHRPQPLLALSDAFIERCDAAGVAYGASIITNGYLLGPKTARALKERRVVSAQVTLDGPPDIHDRMRPRSGGQGSFWRIVENLHGAIEHLQVAVRVNVDRSNFSAVEQLLQILDAEGFAGRINVVPGQLVGVDDGDSAPSATYSAPCFSNRDWAWAEMDFRRLVARYGFGAPSMPDPMGTPCTAVRANELVVGSNGELYKCWENVGDHREVIGHVRDYDRQNSRVRRWLTYDPFSDDECRNCIALGGDAADDKPHRDLAVDVVSGRSGQRRELQHPGGEDHRRGQQEAEACGILVAEAAPERADHRDTRAADAGQQRGDLLSSSAGSCGTKVTVRAI